jgi:pSer/pThr/pTyr-binding forkhead associated (FHA) protein
MAIIPFFETTSTTTATSLPSTTNETAKNNSTPDTWSFELPSWAGPPRGEARLEPVCESLGLQTSVDLRSKTVFRIGRSPKSDVQLHFAFCSRRHALLFHHANGSCYVVDCGSSHGTYVNGVRISSPRVGGVMVPHRVRRGCMIRFGGPGAPVFIVKSFRFDLAEMKDYPASNSPGAMVRLNTRLNALGTSAKDKVLQNLSNKRTFDSWSTSPFESVTAESRWKRQRCSSPPVSQQEAPQRHPPQLVSPDTSKHCCVDGESILVTSTNHKRRVVFSKDPSRIFCPALISPSISTDESDS